VVLGQLHQAVQKIAGLLCLSPSLGVVGQLQQHLGIVAVLESPDERVARGFGVLQLFGLEGGGALPQAGTLASVVEFVGTGDVKFREIAKALGLRILLLDFAGVFVVVRIERARAFHVEQRVHVITCFGEHARGANEKSGSSFGIAGQLGSLTDGVSGAVPLFSGDQAALGGVPEFDVALELGTLCERLTRFGVFAGSLVEHAHALKEHRAPRFVVDRRGILGNDLASEIEALPFL